MDQISKISLNSSNPAAIDAMPQSTKRRRLKISKKTLAIPLAICGLFIVFAVFGVILPVQTVYASAMKTYTQAKIAMDAIKKQNVVVASDELKKTKVSLLETKKELEAFSYIRYIPIVGMYYADANHIVKAVEHGLDAGLVFVDAVKPYADILGLKGTGSSFVKGSAEQRIQTAVLTIGKVTPKIDEIVAYLDLAKKELDEVNTGRYPSFIIGKEKKDQLEGLKAFSDEGIAFVDDARPLIKLIPSLLGESETKRYLIIFQNDGELRPTGGFMTAYAIFRIDKGIIKIERSSDIYNLDNTISQKPKAPRLILDYLPKVSTLHLRDTNLSPDFVESMQLFNSLYKRSSQAVDVDGIIALDTNVLVSTIKILDDEVWAGGIEFTSKIDKRCDCPDVIYKLETLISTPKSLDLRITPLAQVQAARKDIIGLLLYYLMEKSLKSSPKKYWGPLMQNFVKEASEKHIMFYLYDKDAQKGLEALNFAGRIKTVDGDYLHINEANFGGAKSNLFVKEEVGHDIKVESDGTITKTITINYKNPYEPSDCNLERGRLCINAPLRNVVRVYVPKGSTLVDSKGSEVKVSSYEDLGKTVFEGFLTVRPKGSATYTLTYKLPFKLEKGSLLPLLIQKQPGTDGYPYEVKLNGRTVEKFELMTDKSLKLKP